jgi:hypothetical protein
MWIGMWIGIWIGEDCGILGIAAVQVPVVLQWNKMKSVILGQ